MRENVKGRLCLLAVEVVRGVVHAAVPVLVLGVELQTKVREDFRIMEKAPTRAFSWLKAATTAFTFKTLLRHYANYQNDRRLLESMLTKLPVPLCQRPNLLCCGFSLFSILS